MSSQRKPKARNFLQKQTEMKDELMDAPISLSMDLERDRNARDHFTKIAPSTLL